MSELKMALTYDDVLLRPCFSEVLPTEVDLATQFSRNIKMQIPIVSAAMDTVTEAPTAIVMAQNGGIGVIHKNLSIPDQAAEVAKVKKFEAWMILNPITVHPDETLYNVVELTSKYHITGVPVVDEHNVLVGILTSRDLRFEDRLEQKVKDVMTPKARLITAQKDIKVEDAKKLLHRNRIEKLPVIDEDGRLQGLITIRDIMKMIDYPQANKDAYGRLRVAAAVGVGPAEIVRAEALEEAGADALVIDTAHGDSKGVIAMAKELKAKFKDVDVVAGNIATAEACQRLYDVGIDAVKIGIGPGSICTTRIIAGIGVPQLSAVLECAKFCRQKNLPCIADGGIKYSGDITKALAAGASSVMAGSLFAGCDEAPGEMVLYQGRSYKVYRGMGSISAMAKGSKDRYGQGHVQDVQKLVPEGIEGQVPYRGSLASNLYQLLGGVRSGMGYLGAADLTTLWKKAEFVQITAASLKEGHPHDVMITKEAPNYQNS